MKAAPRSNADSSSDADPLAPLVEDYLARAERGERPTIDEYCDAHPGLAEEIRHLFPALQVMEALRPDESDTAEAALPAGDLPEQIGDYRIIAEIGRGGMGVVYEAEQESLGRRVALKVLPGHLQTAEGQTGEGKTSTLRFRQEARAAAQMHHTNIVPVFEVGEDEGRVFYAMQLIAGQSLDQVIEELRKSSESDNGGRLNQPPSDAGAAESGSTGSSAFHDSVNGSTGSKRQRFYRSVAKIGVQVASALDFAHAKGVIHRDIKPANLLLDAQGIIWVTDFGLAKIEDSGLTQTGDFLGTLRYMSPERFRGQCDVRSDLYALGLTLYELLLQRPAFGASDRLRLVQQINDDEPPRPRAVDRRVPRDLETILLKAIDKNPKQRYRSARAMELDLHRFLNDEPIHARRPTFLEQTIRWTRRNRALAAAVGGLFVLLTALLVGASWSAVRQARLRNEADVARSRAEQSLYVAEMNLAGQIVDRAAGLAEIKTVTSAWMPTDPASDLRGWEWYYLRSLTAENVLTLQPEGRGSPIDAVWSPDQSQIATAHSDWRIHLWDASTGEQRKTLKGHPNDVVALAWHPHEPLMAACDDDNNVWVWDLSTGKTVQKFKAPQDALVEQVAWDPSGRRLAWSSNRSVYLWEEGTTHPVELTGGPGIITSLQWSPDGERLAAASWRQQSATIWDASQRKPIRSGLKATLVDWGSTGHELRRWLLATQLGEVLLFEPGSEQPAQRFVGHTTMARFLAWDPSGERLVSAADDNTVRVWDAATGASVRVFQGHAKSALTARFNLDGTKIVSTSRDRTAKVWNAESRQKRTIQSPAVLDTGRSLQDRPTTCSLSWRASGDQLAVVGTDGRLRVWDTAGGKLLFTDAKRWVERASWSPDGRWLAADELEGAALEHYPGDAYMVDTPGKAFVYAGGEGELALKHTLPHPKRCNQVAWSPDGELFATIANDRKMRLWRTDSNSPPSLEQEFDLDGHTPQQVVWNPRETNVLATSDHHGRIRVWRSGQLQHEFTGHRGRLHRLAWSPDGGQLASAGQDATVRLWDLATGELVSVLKGHHNTVFDVQWQPAGERLATAGADGTVKIWNPQTGTELLTLAGHRSAAMAVAWSPDGQQLATADSGGTVLIWDARPAYQEPGR